MLANEELLEMYQEMVQIRIFEEAVKDLFAAGKVPGFVHLSIGQEAVAVGVSRALMADDYVFATHRGHGDFIARGADIGRLMAEIRGKRTGFCKGKGGSMHLFEISSGTLGGNGILGGNFPLVTGVGLALKLRKTKQVVACYFGDGATNEGTFHESMNMSSIWRLPVIWICENNLYSEATPIWATTLVQDIAKVSMSYAMPGNIVDGNDVLEVYSATNEAVERARKGEGPTLIECKTYRQRGHYEGDPVIYRTKEELEAWLKKDPIAKLESRIIESKAATAAQLQSIRSNATALIDKAVRFADESPYPDPQEAFEDVDVA
jgi:pyruvate dehydrogenase E1 component alpha subunit